MTETKMLEKHKRKFLKELNGWDWDYNVFKSQYPFDTRLLDLKINEKVVINKCLNGLYPYSYHCFISKDKDNLMVFKYSKNGIFAYQFEKPKELLIVMVLSFDGFDNHLYLFESEQQLLEEIHNFKKEKIEKILISKVSKETKYKLVSEITPYIDDIKIK